MIHMLKTEKTKPEVLEAHYGSAEPEKVLRILHRDAILAQEKSIGEDVYEKPISEVKTYPYKSPSREPQREVSASFHLTHFNISFQRQTFISDALFPGGSDGKESACNAGYLGLTPG